MRYADLVIDNKSDQTDTLYTYGCDDESITVGSKVYVQFGRSRNLREAYVFGMADEIGQEYKNLKYIEESDENISLTEEMIRTCVWMKKRYLCRYIDAVKLFVPAGKPLKSGKTRNPFEGEKGEAQPVEELTAEQKSALDSISEKEGHEIILLHGVTGSGKTELYMQVIAGCIEKGKRAVMLVPEISLTKQIIDRFIGRFGADRIAVLHSRLSKGERHDEWMRIRRGEADIVIGARSAIFCPVENAGVFIMDEEHEGTYKSEQTPKYDTVEVMVKRAMDMGAKVILGSATPSVVSYSRSISGLYRRIEMKERYNKVQLPDVQIVDMRSELKSGNRSVISTYLHAAMQKTLDEGKQVILFMNRRGYSTFVSCRECGHVIECPDCGISLTYHKQINKGICHYCGHEEQIPGTCPKCGSRYIRYFGTGTEKIDEQVAALFPEYPAARLDLDTMKRKGSLNKILRDFGSGRTKILTGTQVVAKGLDFRNVGLVGIVSADVTLNIPDYRSAERTFQLACQAAGRAGRGDKKGLVVVQTYTPENYAIKAAAAQDYQAFYRQEIEFRRLRQYPPFSDFIQVTVGSSDEKTARDVACEWERDIRDHLGSEERNVLPAAEMLTGPKEGSKYCVLMKCPAGSRKRYFEILTQLKDGIRGDRRKYSVSVDVNPYSMYRA